MSEAVLPPFFPTTNKTCIEVSKEFFDCFSTKAVKTGSNDSSIGERSLSACSNELLKYSKCMSAFENKTPPKRFRVCSIDLFIGIFSYYFVFYRFKMNIECCSDFVNVSLVV